MPCGTPDTGKGTCRTAAQGLLSLDGMVDDYIARHRHDAVRELRWFAIQPSLGKAIEQASMAVSPAGKRLSHQRRIPGAVLEVWREELIAREAQICAATSFEGVYRICEEVAADVHGIGSLAVYDTAQRIGAYLKLEPEAVYLHAGTKQGARALGFRQQRTIPRAALPAPFQRLSASEVEDCLCIYKDSLLGMGRGI